MMRVKVTTGENGGEMHENSADTSTYVHEFDPVDTLHHLLKLHQCLTTAFSAHMEEQHNISLNEYRILMMVGRMDVTASHEIAEATGINIMAISRSVTAVEQRGFIHVGVDSKNRRRKLIRLTSSGQALYNKMVPSADKVARYVFESLKLDEFMTLDRLLETLVKSITAVDEKNQSIFLQETGSEK